MLTFGMTIIGLSRKHTLFLDMQMIIHPEDEIMSLSDVGNQMHHSMNYVFVVSLLPTILTSVSWLCLHFCILSHDIMLLNSELEGNCTITSFMVGVKFVFWETMT
jgi:hypothetical protein